MTDLCHAKTPTGRCNEPMGKILRKTSHGVVWLVTYCAKGHAQQAEQAEKSYNWPFQI